MVDEKLQRKLVRQMRIIKVWMTFIGTFIIIVLVACIWVALQVWSFTKNTKQEIYDVKSSVCNGDGAFSKYLRQKTDACD